MTFAQLIAGRAPPPREIALVNVPTDAERAARLAERVEQAKQSLGTRYALHPANRVERKAA